jgi:hypothetical protein
MKFREFSVPRNSLNSAGTNQLFRLFRLPRNNFLVGNCQSYSTLELKYKFFKIYLGVYCRGTKFLTQMLSLILRTNFLEFGQLNFFLGSFCAYLLVLLKIFFKFFLFGYYKNDYKYSQTCAYVLACMRMAENTRQELMRIISMRTRNYMTYLP